LGPAVLAAYCRSLEASPATWTKPWSAALFRRRSKDQITNTPDEGNEAMAGTLRGARMEERKGAERASQSGR
jgi:hypothetical protein